MVGIRVVREPAADIGWTAPDLPFLEEVVGGPNGCAMSGNVGDFISNDGWDAIVFENFGIEKRITAKDIQPWEEAAGQSHLESLRTLFTGHYVGQRRVIRIRRARVNFSMRNTAL